MQHLSKGRKLGLTADRRTKLLRSLATGLLKNEYLITTAAKAQETRRFTERVISIAKRYENRRAKQMLHRYLLEPKVIQKCVTTIKARYAGRVGGYIRLTKLAPRSGDNAPQTRAELV